MGSRTVRRFTIAAAAIALLAIPTVALAGHFTDVDPADVHAPGIDYLEDTGITAGCTATEFCPGDGLTRAQMGTFLHRASGNAPGTDPSVNAASVEGAGVSELVSGAVVVERDGADAPVVARSLNNVDGDTASITGSAGSYVVDPGFDASGSFVSCTINTNFVDTRDAVCTVNTLANGTIRVRTLDNSAGTLAPAEFHLLVIGHS